MGRYSFQRSTICPFCARIMKSGGGRHIYSCKQRPIAMENNDVIFQYCKTNFPEISNKDTLNTEYNVNLLSLPDLEKKYGIPGGKVIALLDYFGLHRRNSSEGCLLCAQPKIKATCLKKYGALNVLSKNTIIYHKRNLNVMNKYGVDNVSRLYDIKKKLVDDNTFIERYGMRRIELRSLQSAYAWTNKTEHEKEEWLRKSIWSRCDIVISSRTISKLEYKVCKALDIINIPYITQFRLIEKKLYRFYDIKLLYSNVIIEVNGDYYHANPVLYDSNDVINYPGKDMIASDVWKNDYDRKVLANSYGYKVIYVWEYDMGKMNSIELSKYLYEKLKFDNIWDDSYEGM